MVESAGNKTSKFRPGDRVFADTSPAGFGAFAEYAAVPERLLARMPEKMTFEQAAALPQAGVLALQGLRFKGEVKKGQHILINGAGGGVGTLALQMAKKMGAKVTCVDSAGKLDALKALGADHVIDHRETDYTRTGNRYDKILDMVAHRSHADYRRALKPGGVFAMIGGRPGLILQMAFLGPLFSSGKKLGLMPHRPNSDDLDHLGQLLAQGDLTPVIDSTFPLTQTANAMDHFSKGGFIGKIVINI